ncbi:MAG: hypothetical protein JEY71_17735 [Sphaerochaeta sp.]|nr:hypothetical protein [Sphaerochaeta sp.]
MHFLGYEDGGETEKFYIGNSHEFGKYLFTAALHNGYGKYRRTVIISDGRPGSGTSRKSFFPTHSRFYSLVEGVNP